MQINLADLCGYHCHKVVKRVMTFYDRQFAIYTLRSRNWCHGMFLVFHYDDVIMTMLASQITSLTVVYSIVYSGVHQRKHQSSASLAFVREIHRGPVNFPHKWPVTRKMFPFDDVIMNVPGSRCRCGHAENNWRIFSWLKKSDVWHNVCGIFNGF